jgi:Domain of unknown function (DUF4386)
MDKRVQKVWMWAFVAGMFGFFSVGFILLAKYIPPHRPSAAATEIAQLYRDNSTSIRAGLILTMIGATFMLPVVGIFYAQLRRIERAMGEPSVNSMIQVVSGSIAYAAGVIVPLLVWSAASFRPERDPELTRLLNDLGWICFMIPFAPFATQNLALAFTILRDNLPKPLFPKWIGWINIWIIFAGAPAFLILFFKTGPFAWNGVIAFWIPLVLGAAYFALMIVYLFKAIGRDDYGAKAAAA